MKVDLKEEQFYFLIDSLSKKEALLSFLNKSVLSKDGNKVLIEMDEVKADEIRDYCIEKLQESGFDLKYELTAEGKMLEDLIDKFYS